MSPVTESPAVTVRDVTVPPDIARRLEQIARRLDADTKERNRLIVKAHEAGASLREIERVAGISHVGVMKVIRRAE